jgi:hypothetical protein
MRMLDGRTDVKLVHAVDGDGEHDTFIDHGLGHGGGSQTLLLTRKRPSEVWDHSRSVTCHVQ